MDKRSSGKAKPTQIDGTQEDFADMLRKKGDLHEQRCLRRYKENFRFSL